VVQGNRLPNPKRTIEGKSNNSLLYLRRKIALTYGIEEHEVEM
jgi:hypothetical protein